EQLVADIESELSDPAFFTTRAIEAPAFTARLENARADVARLYDRWEKLSK
ncbi:MAG: hypothetical protein EBS96_00670, partial [Spartobacteria bacterium]|nr:hypothetical protein [Spartobacteria bacterium]